MLVRYAIVCALCHVIGPCALVPLCYSDAIPEELVTKGQGIILYDTENGCIGRLGFEMQRLE